MPSSDRAWAIVVAGGAGTRFGGPEPKQFVAVFGKPVSVWALAPFLDHPAIQAVTLVVPEEYAQSPPAWLVRLTEGGVRLAVGGPTRTDSVRSGLSTVEPEAEVVIVHDGARPLVTTAAISRVLDAVEKGRGAIAGRPVRDTLKAVSDDGRVLRTVDRGGLWRAETPQAFPRALLERAYRQAAADRVTASDCAGLCERYGVDVTAVEVPDPNVKITTAGDLELVKAWLRYRSSEGPGPG